MKAIHSIKALETQAADALRALLRQVSAIELLEMKLGPEDSTGRQIDILALVGVYGQSHTLACKVTTSGDLRYVRRALRELNDGAAHLAEKATPVFIAPYLSPEAQALCTESKTGFLDLEDNARLMLGEVFIGKRSIGRHSTKPASKSPAQIAEGSALGVFPPTRAEAPLAACQTAA